jgi:hypothetical protein
LQTTTQTTINLNKGRPDRLEDPFFPLTTYFVALDNVAKKRQSTHYLTLSN